MNSVFTILEGEYKVVALEFIKAIYGDDMQEAIANSTVSQDVDFDDAKKINDS